MFLAIYHAMRRLALPLGRLKAFTLDAGGGDDLAQARRFLRELDQRGCDLIIASLPEEKEIGLAIANRLRRAAGPRDV